MKDQLNKGGMWIPAEILADKALSFQARGVLSFIRFRAVGETWVGAKVKIAEYMHVNRKFVERGLLELQQANRVKVVAVKGGRTTIKLLKDETETLPNLDLRPPRKQYGKKPWADCKTGTNGAPVSDCKTCPDGGQVSGAESCPNGGQESCPDGGQLLQSKTCPDGGHHLPPIGTGRAYIPDSLINNSYNKTGERDPHPTPLEETARIFGEFDGSLSALKTEPFEPGSDNGQSDRGRALCAALARLGVPHTRRGGKLWDRIMNAADENGGWIEYSARLERAADAGMTTYGEAEAWVREQSWAKAKSKTKESSNGESVARLRSNTEQFRRR